MEKNEKKRCFAIRKNVFSLLLFLAGPLALHFKDDLYNLLEKALL
jgi:hypothetical protein